MHAINRRELLGLMGRAAGAAALLQVPSVLYAEPWAGRAAAQTAPTVHATFEAMVAAINGVADDASMVAETAAWIVTEFDKALPPLPAGAPTGAVTAVLDAYTVQTAGGATFATASPPARLAAIRAMVHDPDPAIRQVANQILPFSSFAYWGAAGAPAEAHQPGGPRPEMWDVGGYLGPSHGYADTYMDGWPEGFAPRHDYEH